MSSSARFLWMATEGVTPELILEEAKRLRLISYVDVGGAKLAEVAMKCGDMPEDDVKRLRDAVYRRIGIDDAEEFERRRLVEFPAYQDWLRDRQLHPPLFRKRGKGGGGRAA